MERFYEVLPECFLFDKYFEWRKDGQATNDTVREFAHTHGIESKEYYATEERLYIVPTKKDKDTFSAQLKKNVDGSTGLVGFKQSSDVNKSWVKAVKAAGIKCLHKPHPAFLLGIWGKGTTRLFDFDTKLYMSIDVNVDFENPKNCVEMKGSEFYKIVEDAEERLNQNRDKG